MEYKYHKVVWLKDCVLFFPYNKAKELFGSLYLKIIHVKKKVFLNNSFHYIQWVKL